jgi:hypothetical protein
MSLSANTITGIDISPPFDDKPDRVPLTERDKQGVVDPVGAVIVPVSAKGPLVGPASCDRKIPVFDGYTRFDVDLTYVGQRDVSAKGYKGPTTGTSKSGWRRWPARMCCCRSACRPAR